MNAAITHNERMFISSVLQHGYLPNNNGTGIGDVAPNLFPQDNAVGYSKDEYRVFRISINQLDQPAALSNKRYVFVSHTDDPRRDAMDALFNEAFKNNPNEIVAAAEYASGTQFYSPWKKAFVIELPKATGQFLSNHVVKKALAIATFFIALSSLYSLYAFSSVLLHSTVIPALSFIATQLPPQALFIATYATGIFNFIRENARTCFWASLLVAVITRGVANDPTAFPLVRRVALRANQIAWFVHQSCGNILSTWYHHIMICGNAVMTVGHSFVVIDRIGPALKNHAEGAEEQRLRICKEKAYAVWMRIVEKAPALDVEREQAV
jgi:hypothetical protein